MDMRDVSPVHELMGARPGECVVCYVGRMVQKYDCDGTWRWAQTWREQRAPRASRLERRLQSRGAHCDCELHLRGYEVDSRLLSVAWDSLTGSTPRCMGVRSGSTQPCRLWRPVTAGWWVGGPDPASVGLR